MKKQKVALFERVGSFGYLTCWAFDPKLPDEEADARMPDGYVRLSPWLEIEFPSLDDSAVIESQLKQLDKAEQKAREELQQRLNAINDTRQKILALSFKPAA